MKINEKRIEAYEVSELEDIIMRAVLRGVVKLQVFDRLDDIKRWTGKELKVEDMVAMDPEDFDAFYDKAYWDHVGEEIKRVLRDTDEEPEDTDREPADDERMAAINEIEAIYATARAQAKKVIDRLGK